MQKIGLIGGIGPESTVSYYRQLVHGVKQKQGEHSLPRISIETLSAFEVFAFCKQEQYDALAEYILDGIRSLAAAGAKCAALTGNTPNIVFDRLKASSPIPLVSAIEATVAVAKARGVRKVGLLGTVFTMTNTFFVEPFVREGIAVVVPNASEIAYIHGKIESELEHGIVTDETRAGFVKIIEDMKARADIDQIILGCTELPLLLSDDSSPVPCLDTVAIHVAALVEKITQDEA
ncbi:aspartate/glutamate racemase family protein [Vogesella indigofera]|uniref:aspartate/glutamate racemase family protein n=1 Tax=Vogesella indigofera TaxID=45465 RepID=UPI00234F8A81|nr:amino acid racemase [Vogesella indigofera]MDC7701660.1 amino acid racemase [Vogesella indigofera]